MSFVLSIATDLCNTWVSEQFCVDLTRTLIHFAWQGTVVALSLSAFNSFAIRASANVRYLAAVAALAILALFPPMTYCLSARSSKSLDAVQTINLRTVEKRSDQGAITSSQAIYTVPANPAQHEFDPSADSVAVIQRLQISSLRNVSPFVTSIYIAGVLAMLARLIVAFLAAARLRTASQLIVDDVIHRIIRRLCEQWSIRIVPCVLSCERVCVPVIIGIVRPIILLPPILMTGLSEQQLEALLAHEIAHLRRWDPVVNLAQRIIESFLFLHPAVWYISHRISIEREKACDDLVIANGWRSTDYVSAILGMAELCSGAKNRSLLSASSLAASGNSPSQLKQRVLRMLGETPNPSTRFSHFIVLIPVLLLLGLVSMTVISHRPTSSVSSFELRSLSTSSMDLIQNDGSADSDSKSEVSELKAESSQDGLLINVVIEGNSAIPTSEIAKHIKISRGNTLTQELIKDDVDALVRTRWFSSVEPGIRTEDGAVVYRVVERPIVRRVEYKGLKKFKQKTIDELTQLKPGSPFDAAANRECARRIEEHYHDKGYIFATVELEKGDDCEDREVMFLIHEGPKVKVQSVKFDDDGQSIEVAEKTKTRKKTVTAWMIGGTFDPSTIKDDIEGMKQYYHRLGYFDVAIVPEEKRSDGKSKVELIYHIDEGVRYKVRDIDIQQSNVSEDDLLSLIKSKSGSFFNSRDIQTDVEAIKSKLGDRNRFFPHVDAIPRMTGEQGVIDLEFSIDRGAVYHVRNIDAELKNQVFLRDASWFAEPTQKIPVENERDNQK